MSAANPYLAPDPEEFGEWDDQIFTDPADPRLVLVVDDSRVQRKLLSTALRKWGYEVLEAETGQEGLAICKQHDISIVISDWMMPKMNGPEFCQAFRQLERQSYGYFILLTSKGKTGEVAEGLNSGADDFLTKPVSNGELKARLQAGERIVQMQSQLVEKNLMVNRALEKIQKLYDGLEKDLKEARSLQQSLVPETDITMPNGQISLMLRPSGHVGGDLVGQFPIGADKIGLFSLDVSGHGISSALLTARLAGYLLDQSPKRNIALKRTTDGSFEARDPADTARRLNDLLLRDFDTEHYFTLALSIVDLTSGQMISVQAGHPHPVLIRAGAGPQFIGDGDLPIGLIPGATYQCFETQISPGDRIVLYSDGITECAGPDGAMLDEEGFSALLSNNSKARGQEFLDDLMWDIQSFHGQREFDDDISLLVFDYTGPRGSGTKTSK